MSKYSEIDPEYQRINVDHTTQRFWQLNGLVKGYSDAAIRYLFLTNSGGAVAVLSFMATSDSRELAAQMTFPLVLFGVGLVLVGVLTAILLQHTDWALGAWNKGTREYLRDEMDWDDLIEQDDQRADNLTLRYLEYGAGYLSFALFIAGCVVAGARLI